MKTTIICKECGKSFQRIRCTQKFCSTICRNKAKYRDMPNKPERSTWRGMHARCSNPNQRMYARYGGRGIRVCDAWASFETFLEDMGLKPTEKHEIDRINNDGNYELANCRWVTRLENAHNRSSNKLSMEDARAIRLQRAMGEKSTSVIAERYGVSCGTIQGVLAGRTWKEVT